MAAAGRRKRRLWDAYAFPGFRPEATVRGIFGDPKARIVRLKRRSKKRAAPIAEPCIEVGTIAPCGDTRVYLEIEVRRVLCKASGKVRRERLEFLADNPLYTKRFATFVGRRCRASTIKDVAKELRLDWETVKELNKQYMRAQLARAGTPAPKVIGIEGLNGKIRVLRRRAYGLRDEEYLPLKVLTSMLPQL